MNRIIKLLCAAWIGPAAVFGPLAASAEKNVHPITALDLVNVRDIGGHHRGAISVSPDGQYVAFQLQVPNIEMRNYDLSWHIIETEPSGTHREVDDGGPLILNPDKSWLTNGNRPPVEAQWSLDSEWIFYLKEIDGSPQIWRSKRDGSITEQLTYNAAHILSFQLSDDGHKVYFTVAIPDEVLSKQLQEEGDRGFLYDNRFRPHTKIAPFVRTCGTNKEGRVRSVSLERDCVPPVWIYDIAGQTEREATPEEVDAYRSLSAISNKKSDDRVTFLVKRRDADSVVWLENEDPVKYPGYSPPLRLFASLNGDENPCYAKECSGHRGVIENVWWRPGGDEIIFQRADGSNRSMTGLYSWKPRSNEVRKIIRTEDKLADCEIFESKAICLREQWTHPGTICVIYLASGDIETIYDPNPEFNQFEFPKIEKVEWRDQFSNPTHGHLIYPLDYEDGFRYPLVITTYRSRGFLRGGVGDEYPILVLAANDFLVLSHDKPRRLLRDAIVPHSGQAQFEGNYERRSSLSAQEKILDILDNRGLIDPKRVAITGLSDGADQVFFALIQTNKFAAAIASNAFDYRSWYYSDDQQGRAFWRRLLGGAPHDDTAAFYKSLSLALNTKKVNTPLLINVSDYELQYSIESVARLQDAGRAVEMYVFPGEYHIKWQPQHRLAIYRRNIQWLKFWLQGEEVKIPADSEHYARWRKMRDDQCGRLKDKKDAPWYCRL